MSTSLSIERWNRFYALLAASQQTRPPFRFKDLPIEIAIHILGLAITTPMKCKTYLSLITVSRQMQVLAYEACLPHMHIVLLSLAHFESFYALLQSNPIAIGKRIRAVWFIAAVKASTERTLGFNILQKCPRITRIACNINLLKELVGSPTEFAHPYLKDLTLIEPKIPWRDLLRLPAGRQLFSQLTHLRTTGGTGFEVTPGFCFASLTHLSFACDCDWFTLGSTSQYLMDLTQFPVLQQVVPSVPYVHWRLQDPVELRDAAREMDRRFKVIPCPKKWKELDVWEESGSGERSLWTRAQSTEFDERRPAITKANFPPPGLILDFALDGE